MAALGILRLALAIGSLVLAGCVSDVKRSSDVSPNRPPALRERGEVTLDAALGCPTYNERSRKCLLLTIGYSAATTPIIRPSLNIALVLDRSNSMREGQKLAYVLAAARGIVQNMTERDTLSIVAINEQATIVAAAGRVVNKPFLYHRLEEIFASGHADLSAGLREGITQVQRVSAQGQVRQVLLLTDALAIRGRTASASLQKDVQEASALGISVSTFGVGSDHNGRLLAALAALGGGRYAYIKSPDGISMAMALNNVLHDPLPIVARDASIRVTLTQGHIRKLYGQLPAPPTRTQILPIGDLLATERGFVMAALEPAAFAFGTTIQAEVRLDFVDPLTNKPQSRRIRLQSSYAADSDGTSADGTSRLALLADVLTALELADAAARGLDLESYRQAKASFELVYGQAHEYSVQHRDQELLNQVFVLKHFMEELGAADREGLLHGHEQIRKQFPSERDYLRYLLTHHRQ